MSADLTGLLLIAVGVFLGYQARRRRFDRTNVFGVERSPTYWGGVKARDGHDALGCRTRQHRCR